jgi:hypothetical protein
MFHLILSDGTELNQSSSKTAEYEAKIRLILRAIELRVIFRLSAASWALAVR